MCCQWVRRGRKVTPDNPDARSPITAFKECDGESRHGIVLWMRRDTVGHQSLLFDCMGLFIRSAACRRQEGCWHFHSSNKFNAAPAASFNPKTQEDPDLQPALLQNRILAQLK